MEKYGVEESEVKTGSTDPQDKCPKCGTKLLEVEETGIKLCPVCGSKPFEE